MLILNSDSVPDYMAAVIREIEPCIGTCTIQVPDTSDESIFHQIHALKNAPGAIRHHAAKRRPGSNV
ncbi:hypothetical protein [Xanthomonas translucens]|uniref:hypothetical protein n=1 Tax=Xanthomonas campestris pv. translucens TaxID=343 RepID=UPI001F6116B9|nr:hypothetical protein [Xanthomonas translucens]UNU11467.1 hypothetical protein KBV71_00790 [Xanthomonas translucens pv. translucens]